jgi:hypothetical protein
MTKANAGDKKAMLRDRRAQAIAIMGLVKREGDRFRITGTSLRGQRQSYEIWRDETGKVRCSCPEFKEQVAQDAAFRCEHILAVKYSLAPKDATPSAKEEKGLEDKAVSATGETLRAEKSHTEPQAIEQSEITEVRTNAGAAANGSSVHSEEEKLVELKNEQMEKEGKAGTEPQLLADEAEDDSNLFTEGHKAPVVPIGFANLLRKLRQPVDPKLIKTREGWTDRDGNKHMVEYVEWHTVADILDRVAPTWSHAVRNIVQIGDMVAVTAAITIDGVTREGVGTGAADNETGIKKAEHDALKRAAIKFGIARDLYQRESEVSDQQGIGPQANEFPRDPLAKSLADLVTPKQLSMMRALARLVGVDVEAECQAVLRCKPDEMSKRAASSFIDYLKRKQQELVADGMRRAS